MSAIARTCSGDIFASSSERPTNPSMVSATASLPVVVAEVWAGPRAWNKPRADMRPVPLPEHGDALQLRTGASGAATRGERHRDHALHVWAGFRVTGPEPLRHEARDAAENGEA